MNVIVSKCLLNIYVFSEEKEDVKKPPLAEMEAETPELDEDGYVIRPTPQQTWPNEKSFYSSSDSDSGKYIPMYIFVCYGLDFLFGIVVF